MRLRRASRPRRRPAGAATSPRLLGWVLAATVLTLLPLARHLPPWVPAAAMLPVAWRWALLWRQQALPPRWLLAVLAVIAAAAVVLQFGTFSGREPGVSLLSLMVGLKLLETRAQRDLFIAICIGLFLAISHFFFSQHMLVAAYVALLLLVYTAVLLAFSAGERQPRPWPWLRRAGLMLAQSLPIMLVMFLLFPRLSGPLWGLPDTGGQAVTGLSDEMRPGSISRLVRSSAVAFRVTFEAEPPPGPERYWRGPVMERFDGRRWSATPERRDTRQPPVPADDDPIRQTVRLEPHQRQWLLALDTPVSVPNGARMTDAYELVAGERVTELHRYTVASAVRVQEDRLTRRQRRRALHLPDAVAPRAKALARQWRAISEDRSSLVEHALRYFSEEPFRYTLQPSRLQGDPVDRFLFETREGFCEHYAGAFVVLMRAAGIPARVVTGYLGGEWNPLGDYLLVRQSDAHAWAEVWLPPNGWRRVDPTAAVSPERIEQGVPGSVVDGGGLPALIRIRQDHAWIHRLSLAWDSVNHYWNEWVVAFGPEKQRQLLARLGLGDLRAGGMILAIVAGLTALTLIYTAVFYWRARPSPPSPEQRAYQRFCARLARRGLPRRPGEGPWDYARRIARERPELAEQAWQVTGVYTRLRYSPYGRTEDLRRLRRLVSWRQG